MTDFDRVPNRRNPYVLNKWTKYPKDVLPMWIADMDFPAPKPILDALHKAVSHGVLGYEEPSIAFYETVAARMDRLYGWKVKPDTITAVTGIVSGFNVAARAFCTPQKGLLIQTPVYNEFYAVKENVGIPQIPIPFVKSAEGNILRYEIDWDLFKKQAKKACMLLLCSPHNPLGIIFSRKDLLKMAEICISNKLLIVADEIHAELLLDGNEFTPMAKLSPEIAKHTITLISPSKTFNVPGLHCGFAIIPNKELRARYVKVVGHLHMSVASLGLTAARAAFSGQCDGWLKDLRNYLSGNRDFLVDYVTEYMPDAKLTVPDATYLGWLDFSAYELNKSPFDFFLRKAKVGLSDGKIFGNGSEDFVRINFGTPRRILKQGLDKMWKALNAI